MVDPAGTAAIAAEMVGYCCRPGKQEPTSTVFAFNGPAYPSVTISRR